MKEITFILPGKDDKPVGGYKIVYEYANRFANADYKVNLIYHHIELDYKDRNLFLRVKRYFGFLYHRARHHYNAGEWFNLSSKINKVYLYRTNNRGMKKFRNSYAIATAKNLVGKIFILIILVKTTTEVIRNATATSHTMYLNENFLLLLVFIVYSFLLT